MIPWDAYTEREERRFLQVLTKFWGHLTMKTHPDLVRRLAMGEGTVSGEDVGCRRGGTG